MAWREGGAGRLLSQWIGDTAPKPMGRRRQNACGMTTTNASRPLVDTAAIRTPFPLWLAVTGLVLGSGFNTAEAVFGSFAGGIPLKVTEKLAWQQDHPLLSGLVVWSGVLAMPFMVIAFLVVAHLLGRRKRRLGRIFGVTFTVGMWGFFLVEAAELLQYAANRDGADGKAAAAWLHDGIESPAIALPVLLSFLVCVLLGMLVFSIVLLITGAVPRWIGAAWLLFIVLDIVEVPGPIDPHVLWFAGAVGVAVHIARDGGKVWNQG